MSKFLQVMKIGHVSQADCTLSLALLELTVLTAVALPQTIFYNVAGRHASSRMPAKFFGLYFYRASVWFCTGYVPECCGVLFVGED